MKMNSRVIAKYGATTTKTTNLSRKQVQYSTIRYVLPIVPSFGLAWLLAVDFVAAVDDDEEMEENIMIQKIGENKF